MISILEEIIYLLHFENTIKKLEENTINILEQNIIKKLEEIKYLLLLRIRLRNLKRKNIFYF